MIKELITIMGSSKIATLPYSKEENGVVERANREVIRHLRAFVFHIGLRQEWVKYLPLVMRIMNSTVHTATGVSPASLLFGNSIDLDRGIFLPMEAVTDAQHDLSSWSADMLHTQQQLLKIAEMQQRSKDLAHTSQSDMEPTSFEPNSLVLVQYPEGAMGSRPPSKLHTQWRGPLRVLANTGPHYKLLDMVDNKVETHHIKHLKPFCVDANVNPQAVTVARKDKEEFVVQAIIRHIGDPKRKTGMDFLVRWEGYDDSHNLWLPWNSLRNNSVLHEYLQSKGLRSLIPTKFRN